MVKQSSLIEDGASEQRGDAPAVLRQPGPEPAPASADPEAAVVIGAFVAALDKAARARRLYQANNPVYRGFLTGLQAATERKWQELG
ncbi:MAG: hypothetical protein FIB01_05595, partial [Gemmatimonadetes bacterium]|nr:hypothetical protein [Gemmatimonadota bacterium]